MNKKRAVIIVGPTAVGKTAAAIQLAEHFGTKIISADSRQCFKELNIGVAKPSEENLLRVQHFFINSHSIHENVHAASFERLALGWAREIFLGHDLAVMVGGTGLYVKAFSEGMDEMPPVDLPIRIQIQSDYMEKGIGWLQDQIKKADPVFYGSGDTRNPQRLMRALEIKWGTGRSILSFHSNSKKPRPFEIKKIGILLPKETLHANIDRRVEHMFEEGLEREAASLYPYRNLNALQTVGYAELFDYFDGKINLHEARELVKKHTRHYAKRQMTWFKRDAQTQWILPEQLNELKKITQS